MHLTINNVISHQHTNFEGDQFITHQDNNNAIKLFVFFNKDILTIKFW